LLEALAAVKNTAAVVALAVCYLALLFLYLYQLITQYK
jgi:hypothetical protein